MMATREEITENVRAIYRELRTRKKVRFHRDFLGDLDLSDATVSSILNERAARPRFLPSKYYDQIIKQWDINPDFFFEGNLPMFTYDAPKPSIFEELNENIKTLIKELKKYNASK